MVDGSSVFLPHCRGTLEAHIDKDPEYPGFDVRFRPFGTEAGILLVRIEAALLPGTSGDIDMRLYTSGDEPLVHATVNVNMPSGYGYEGTVEYPY